MPFPACWLNTFIFMFSETHFIFMLFETDLVFTSFAVMLFGNPPFLVGAFPEVLPKDLQNFKLLLLAQGTEPKRFPA